MHRIYGDADVMRHVGHGSVADLAATRAMLVAYIAHQAAHGFSFWGVVERESGELIGDAGLYTVDGDGLEVELGYTLGRAWWGRGLATEAARACVGAAFRELRLGALVAVADPDNAPSIRVLEKLGFRYQCQRLAYGRMHAHHRLGAPHAELQQRPDPPD